MTISGEKQDNIRPASLHGGRLQIDDLSVRFGGVRVFQKLNIIIDKGEVLGIIGPNGAGKTTLVNVITGSVSASEGRIFFDGHEITGRSTHAVSRMGVVRSFQQTSTFRPASVRENISRAILFSGASDSVWQRISGLLEEFELAPQLEERSDKLPYGQQKMLGLVMSYVTSPRVLLLDEPAAGLDRRERYRVDRFLDEARRNLGCSILIIEHDMDLIRRLCPRVLVLNAGSVIADGRPADVLSDRSVIDAYLGSEDEE
jgi:ABC-type branched-subunit amino acid transport system ATPase component